jgi:hypothetical protein
MAMRVPLLSLLRALVLLLLLATLAPFPVASQPLPSKLYLPLLQNMTRPSSVFGLEASSIVAGRNRGDLADLGPTWIRKNGLSWAAVEPVEGAAYQWDTPSVAALEQEMIAASQLGVKLIVIVQGSPAWATAPYTVNCAPINPASQGRFASFLAAAVERYSQSPYNVRYWEIGNEPDAPVFAGDSVFGCWGNTADPYYGGQAYGAMLNVIYPVIKAANPASQVLFGGLLLDSIYNPETGEGASSRFLEGALIAGAGNSFDILAYHAYSFYDGSADGSPQMSWKVPFLRDVLVTYGVSKPLFNTEAALLCGDPSLACQQAQAYAIPRLYARAMRDSLQGFIWYIYDSDSFRNTALIEPTNPAQQRPAYVAYRYARSVLQGAQYYASLPGLPAGAEGYIFVAGQQAIALAWSNAAQSLELPFTQPLIGCSEWDGQAAACTNADGVLRIELGPAPRYIMWRTS